MTNPREDELRGLFGTLNTESQETLTSARGAIDRQGTMITDLQSSAVSEGTTQEFRDQVAAIKQANDEAQAAFDAIGVASPPVGRKRGGK